MESLGIDVPTRRDLLTRNHLGHNLDAFRIGATVAAGVDKAAVSTRSCSICGSTFVNRTADFAAHIRGHRGDDGSEVHQCEECGASFATAASWSRHRLLVHRIRPQPPEEDSDELLPENEEGMEREDEDEKEPEEEEEEKEQDQVEQCDKEWEEGDSDSERQLVIDTGE